MFVQLFTRTNQNHIIEPGLYWVVHKLTQIHTANPATFQIQIRKITVQICGNFWVTQYVYVWTRNIIDF